MARRTLTRRALTRSLGTAAALAAVPGLARAAALTATPRQVEGPFYPVDERADTDLDLTRIAGRADAAAGEVVLVRGRVLDTSGAPVPGAVVDVWQANHHGRYDHPRDPNPAPLDPNFQGRGIVRADASGTYALRTIKPGPYRLDYLGGSGWRCRHIHFKVSGAAHAHQPLITQMYFRGDPLITDDAEIAKAPADRRDSLIADMTVDPRTGLPLYTFDIVLARA